MMVPYNIRKVMIVPRRTMGSTAIFVSHERDVSAVHGHPRIDFLIEHFLYRGGHRTRGFGNAGMGRIK